MKNLILLSDGTWKSGGEGTASNVWKLYQTLNLRSESPDQMAFYYDGVGTSNFRFLQVLGGAFGRGLKANVLKLYEQMLRNYEDGDKLFLFGFSRGSYTIRLLTGLISEFGACKNLIGHEDEAYRAINAAYITGKNPEAPSQLRSQYGISGNPSQPDDPDFVPIEFVGLWDTVDAIGGPFDQLRGMINKLMPYQFHNGDKRPVANIKNGYHALGIDEARGPFLPVMWDEEGIGEDQTIEQVWFAGVHSNIGGGYPKPGVSLEPFTWIVDKAKTHGLELIELEYQILRNRANVHSTLYDSRAGLAAYYPYEPRDVAFFQEKHAKAKPKIHYSAMERIAWRTHDYAPVNLPLEFEVCDAPADNKLPDPVQISKSLSEKQATKDEANKVKRHRIRLYWLFIAFTVLSAAVSIEYIIEDRRMDIATISGPSGQCYKFVAWLSPVLHDELMEPVFFSSCHNLWVTFTGLVILSLFLIWKNRLFRKTVKLGKALWRGVLT